MDRRGRDDIAQIGRFAKWMIWGVTALIAIVFAGVTLKDIPFGPALSSTNPDYLQAIILTIYVWCWAAGTTIDTNFQSAVYMADPQGGHVRTGSLVAVAGLAIVVIALLLVRSNELWFAVVLAVFSLVDVLAWLYLRYSFLPPIIEATQKKYSDPKEPDHYGQLLLNIVVTQITGNWKWWRQLAMSAVIAAMIVIALSPHAKDVIAEWLASAIRIVYAETIKRLIPSLMFLIFVLVSEIWYFAYRLYTFLAIRIIRGLEEDYSIAPRHKT